MFTLKLSSPASLNVNCFLLGFTPFLQSCLWALILLEICRVMGVWVLVLIAAVWNFSLTIFPLTHWFQNHLAHALAQDLAYYPFPTPDSQLPFLQIYSLYPNSSKCVSKSPEVVMKMPLSGPHPRSNESESESEARGFVFITFSPKRFWRLRTTTLCSASSR